MRVWEYGNMGVWECGSMGVWECGSGVIKLVLANTFNLKQ